LLGGVLVYLIPGGAKALQPDSKREPTAVAREARDQNLPPGGSGVSRISEDTGRVGTKLYTYASLPFEIASLLLLVAIVGSVMLARTLKQEIAADDVDPEVVKQAGGSETGTVAANE